MIKSIIKENDSYIKREYPYLGIFPDGEIVFFTSETVGVCVHATTSEHIFGKVSYSWHEEKAKIFEGELILKNAD